MIVDTEKVLREADGSVKLVVIRPHTDGKVFAPGCASKAGPVSREEPEDHKWSNEKPKLDNARRLRGIYFIDFEEKEFKETIENARKKLETPMAPAMPCKTSKT